VSERDELARLIEQAITADAALDAATDHGRWDSGSAQFDWAALAAAASVAILAAGWRPT